MEDMITLFTRIYNEIKAMHNVESNEISTVSPLPQTHRNVKQQIIVLNYGENFICLKIIPCIPPIISTIYVTKRKFKYHGNQWRFSCLA